MSAHRDPNPVLYVEDEENDVVLMQYAFQKANVARSMQYVNTGQDAIDYLSGTGRFADRRAYPLPCLLLLDLNLPLLSGMEVLQWIHGQTALANLPVVVFTSSEHPRDKEQARQLGAADYLLKPADPRKYVELVRQLQQQWLQQG